MSPSAQPLDGGAPVDWALAGPALVGLAPVGPAPTAFQARCCSSVGTGLHTSSAAALALTVLNLLYGACWGSGAGTKLCPSPGAPALRDPSAVVGVVSNATRAPWSRQDG